MLSHLWSEGVEELYQENLTPLLRLKYNHSISGALANPPHTRGLGRRTKSDCRITQLTRQPCLCSFRLLLEEQRRKTLSVCGIDVGRPPDGMQRT